MFAKRQTAKLPNQLNWMDTLLQLCFAAKNRWWESNLCWTGTHQTSPGSARHSCYDCLRSDSLWRKQDVNPGQVLFSMAYLNSFFVFFIDKTFSSFLFTSIPVLFFLIRSLELFFLRIYVVPCLSLKLRVLNPLLHPLLMLNSVLILFWWWELATKAPHAKTQLQLLSWATVLGFLDVGRCPRELCNPRMLFQSMPL